MKKIVLLILMIWSIGAISQEKLEIDGKVKITEMDPSNSDSIVVWNSNGTLSMRLSSTLTEKQIMSISNDTIYLSGGDFVKLPAEVDGDVTNEKITNFGITGDSLSITEGGITMGVAVDSSNTNEIQQISLISDSLTLSDGGGKVRIDTSNTNEKIISLSITGDSLSITEGDMTMKIAMDSSNTNELELPQSPNAGEMLYWNGTAWVNIASGETGQTLTFVNGVPTWIGPNTAGTSNVLNPVTGKIWMDRNLGATQVAISSNDYLAYGDLYQWGRGSDGHEKITWTSSTTSDGAEQAKETSTPSNMDVPGHGDFILAPSSPFDWRSPKNDALWQGMSGTNNPCPAGYRIPTEAEWDEERLSWRSNNAAGAFASPLKLPAAGYRSNSNGSLSNVGSDGIYWSSTVSGTNLRILNFVSNSANMDNGPRAYGYSVRCIKD